jgi:hypothetical protein
MTSDFQELIYFSILQELAPRQIILFQERSYKGATPRCFYQGTGAGLDHINVSESCR